MQLLSRRFHGSSVPTGMIIIRARIIVGSNSPERCTCRGSGGVVREPLIPSRHRRARGRIKNTIKPLFFEHEAQTTHTHKQLAKPSQATQASQARQPSHTSQPRQPRQPSQASEASQASQDCEPTDRNRPEGPRRPPPAPAPRGPTNVGIPGSKIPKSCRKICFPKMSKIYFPGLGTLR